MLPGAETFTSEPHTHIYEGKNGFYQNYVPFLRHKYVSNLCLKVLFFWSVNMAFGAIFESKQDYGAALVAIGSENQMGTLSGISVRQYERSRVCPAEQSTAVTP